MSIRIYSEVHLNMSYLLKCLHYILYISGIFGIIIKNNAMHNRIMIASISQSIYQIKSNIFKIYVWSFNEIIHLKIYTNKLWMLLLCIFLCECIYIIITHKNYCAPLFRFGWPGLVGLARGATKKIIIKTHQYKF